MNAKRKNPPPKWAREKLPRRPITPNKRQRILAKYEKQLKRGVDRDEVLYQLSQENGVGERTVERWISLAREERPHAPTEDELGHWNVLSKVAAELLQDLQFPRTFTSVPNMFENYTINLRWYNDGFRIRFATEQNAFYISLMNHLDAEFRKPQIFSREIQELQDTAFKMANDNTVDFFTEIRSHEYTADLYGKLTLIVGRGTFKGVCGICRNWQGVL